MIFKEYFVLRITILAVISIFTCFPALASNERNTTLSIEAGKDESGNRNTMISADIRLNATQNVFFGAGSSEVPSGSVIIKNNQAYGGFSNKFSDKWKITGILDYSGLKDAFTMVSISAGMKFSIPVFYLELVPAYRRIKLTTLNNRHVFINSGGLGVKSGVYLGDHFRLSGSAYTYNYSRDVSLLASFASTRFFSTNTLLLSSGLLEETKNIETGLDFTNFSLSLGRNKSISAIDFSESNYGYIVFDYYFSDAWSMSIFAGKYDDTPEDQDNFSSLTVSYAF